MYECPNCGGQLRFDIEKQKLLCDNCSSEFAPDTEMIQENAGETDEFGAQVFECPNCGAKMITTNVNVVSFCSYCGTSAVIPGRIANEKKPAYILPFKKTKEDCIKEYKAHVRRSVFAPKEFRDPKFLDTFRGIYMPYWLYDFRYTNTANVEVYQSSRSGDYILTDYYDMQAPLDAEYTGLAYDASAAFNDITSNGILPWNEEEIKPFSPGYMCGFYADTEDVPKEVYEQDAGEIAAGNVFDSIRKTADKDGYDMEEPSTSQGKVWHLGGCQVRARRALLPVWFLTWRRKDRVAYAVMNGENGKLTADLPVDMKRYLIGSLLMAVPFFLLFSLHTVTSYTLLTIAQVLAAAAALIYYFERKDIDIWETRRKDKGYMYLTGQTYEAEKKSRESGKERMKIRKTLFMVYFIFIFSITLLSSAAALISDAMTSGFLPVLVSIAALIVLLAVIGVMRKNSDDARGTLRCLYANLLTGIAAAVISIAHPANDVFYYAASVLWLLTIRRFL